MLDLLSKTMIVASNDQKQRLLETLLHPPQESLVVSWLNAHSFSMAQTNVALHDSLMQSSLLLRDGIGVAILLFQAKKDPGLNMNGTDLIPEILRRARGRRVALLGTAEPYLSTAAEKVKQWGADVVLLMDGFQPMEAYENAISEIEVDLVVLAMGVPKQEQLSVRLSKHRATPILILNGGAILDFIAERFPRAPRIIRWLHLEWLFRLMQEPMRLWRRYILGAFELFAQARHIRRAARE